MSTRKRTPQPREVLARARAAREQMAAALDEDHEPDPDESLGWQPIWKRPRKPKSKAARRGGAAQAAEATPGSRQAPPCREELASAPLPAEPDRQRRRAPRCPRLVPGAALQRLAVVTVSGTVH